MIPGKGKIKRYLSNFFRWNLKKRWGKLSLLSTEQQGRDMSEGGDKGDIEGL